MNKSIKIKSALIMSISLAVFTVFSLVISYIFYSDAVKKSGTQTIYDTQTQFFIIFICAELIIAIFIIVIFVSAVDTCVVKPIMDITDIITFDDEDEKNAHEKINSEDFNNRLKNLDINSGDEIEALYHSIQKMQMDINDFVVNVKEDNWESEHDSMTMLSNITKFEKRKKDVYPFVETIYIACIDVINMSIINTRLSTNVGDSIISKVARELRRISCDTIHSYRLHDDYFVIVFCGYEEEEAIKMIDTWNDKVGRLNRSTDNFDCRLVWGGSFGEHNFNVDDVFKRADAEMYCKKMIIKKEIGSNF